MKVTKLPAATTYTAVQALDDAKQMNLNDVLILGYDENDTLVVRSSRMTREQALFLIKLGELHTLGVIND
jgi:hypothetical protein